MRHFFKSISVALLAGWAMTGTAAAQSSDTLTVGIWDFPAGHGNPYHTVFGQPHVYMYPTIFDTMTYVVETGSAEPGLATAWKNTSPTTWEFSLRSGTQFQNGEPFNAEAIIKVLEWFKSEEAKVSPAARSFSYLDSARAIDDHTIEIKTTAPRPLLPNMLAALYVVPPKAWADMGIQKFAVNPIGTGPYRVTEWTGENVSLEAVDNSWRTAKIPKMSFNRLTEQAARVQALLSGQIDIMIRVFPDNFAAIRAAGGTIDASPSPLLLQMAFLLENVPEGVDVTPLRDKRVRHALNYAVDKVSINENLMGGLMGLNTQYAVPGSFGYDPTLKPYEYDPDKARKLLAEAGYPNGFKLSVEVRDFPDVFVQVASDLSKVGVQLDVNKIVNAEWGKKFLGVLWEAPTFSLTLGVAPEMDANRPMIFQSCRREPAYYCNKEVMPLIDAADAEFDMDKRRELLHELAAKLREDAPAIFLFEQKELNAYSKRVRGFKNVNRIVRYENISFAN